MTNFFKKAIKPFCPPSEAEILNRFNEILKEQPSQKEFSDYLKNIQKRINKEEVDQAVKQLLQGLNNV